MLRNPIVLASLMVVSLALAGCTADPPAATAPVTGEDAAAQWPVPQGETSLARAVDAFRTADARLFGAPTSVADRPDAASLTGSILALAADHGIALDVATLLDLRVLETLPAPTAAALQDTIEAYRDLDHATMLAFRTADPGAAPDLAPVATAQHHLAAAALVLEAAVREHGTMQSSADPMRIGNVLSIDLAGADDVYWGGFHLVIDIGGSDSYHNNAGGNGVDTDHCRDQGVGPVETSRAAAAALIDLAGDDVYDSGRDCGVAGGAMFGSGFLLDAAGDDTYDSGGRGTNGGGYGLGIGALIDAAGDDVYSATGAGTNGGGYAGGIGRLVDGDGDDTYAGLGDGVNGGGSSGYTCTPVCGTVRPGFGLLFDLGGTDVYTDLYVHGETDATVVPKESGGAQVDMTASA